MIEKISSQTENMETLLIKPRRHSDHRGFFAETYNKKKFLEKGISATSYKNFHELTLKMNGVEKSFKSGEFLSFSLNTMSSFNGQSTPTSGSFQSTEPSFSE